MCFLLCGILIFLRVRYSKRCKSNSCYVTWRNRSKSYSDKFHKSEIPSISWCSKLMHLSIVINIIGKKCLPSIQRGVAPGVQGAWLGQRPRPSLPEPNRSGRCARSSTRGDGTYALAVGEQPGLELCGVIYGTLWDFPSKKKRVELLEIWDIVVGFPIKKC